MRKSLTTAVFVALASSGAAEPVTIAALGDSLTQGYGLTPSNGFVPQLEQWLQRAGADIQLINAGVSGDTTAGGAARVDWTLTPDVDAMIIALGSNDLLRGIDPKAARANMRSILEAGRAANVEMLIVGAPAPNNFGPDYKLEFDAIYPDLAAEFDALYVVSFFAGISGVPTDPAALQPFLQADGLHPTAEGVALIVDGIGPSVLELVSRSEGN